MRGGRGRDRKSVKTVKKKHRKIKYYNIKYENLKIIKNSNININQRVATKFYTTSRFNISRLRIML